ncbi:conjugal transfer protein [Salmonella enterica subsp. enterica serovar Oranienburg]|nr:conjugal transfer protein [Salmonella enterica subsp. enterica serovar Oranienburg]
MKKMLMVCILFLSACSFPPEPPQVEWEKRPEVMNTQIMNWTPTSGVIKSGNISSSWSKVLSGFRPENRLYDDSVFYAVAHSEKIVVRTSSFGGYWTAKNWLRRNGATGVIEYQPLKRLLNNDYVEIYLSRMNIPRLP